MTFKIDAEKQVLTPIYYENPLMNVQFDLNNTPEEQKNLYLRIWKTMHQVGSTI